MQTEKARENYIKHYLKLAPQVQRTEIKNNIKDTSSKNLKSLKIKNNALKIDSEIVFGPDYVKDVAAELEDDEYSQNFD